MKLTRLERWTLSNQYKIMALVDPANRDEYDRIGDALDSGFEREYGNLAPYIVSDGAVMSDDQCRDALDILDMFQAITYALDDLEDTSGLNLQRLRFSGFDGNTEGKYIHYLKYLQQDERFTNVNGGDGNNSHHQTLPRYREMVAEWERSPDKYRLTKDDLLRLQDVTVQ